MTEHVLALSLRPNALQWYLARTVDDDAHCTAFAMFNDQHHRARKAWILHCPTRDKKSPRLRVQQVKRHIMPQRLCNRRATYAGERKGEPGGGKQPP